jgi:hypothetical protein
MDASAIARAFDAFFLRYRVHAEVPALMRIAMASFLLGHFFLVREDVWELIRPTGLFPAKHFAEARKGLPQVTAIALFPTSERWAATIFALTFVSGFLALIGLWTPVALWTLLVCVTSVQARMFIAAESGADSIIRSVLFFLACTDTASAFAIDALLGGARHATVAGWGLRNIQLLVCAAYFWSAVHKLYCRAWSSGVAIRNTLLWPNFARWPNPPVLRMPRLLRAANHATIVFEFFAPFGFYVRPLDRLFLAAGVAFHLGIIAFLRLGTFGPAMLIALMSFGEPVVDWALTAWGP